MTTENPKGKPLAILIGASRGIGRQVAIDLANNGYYVVVSAKTTSNAAAIPAAEFPPDPNSSKSTINTVVREITEAGGDALALPVDVRNPNDVVALVDESVRRLGTLSLLLYNSGAIWWSSLLTTPLPRFLLMQRINPEGLYAAVSASLPHFQRQNWTQGRIIVISPPIYSRFFRGKTAYAMGKVGMSVLTKGLAFDFDRLRTEGGFKGHDMAVASLWPAVAIESAATQGAVNTDQEVRRDLRKATIFSDAILEIISSKSKEVNGRLLIDEDFLREKGMTDFSKYSLVEGASPRRIMPKVLPGLEVEEQADEGRRVDSVRLREGRESAKL